MSACVQCGNLTVPASVCSKRWWWHVMNRNVWILLLWCYTGYLHISVRSATQSGSIFPFTSSCLYLVALHYLFQSRRQLCRNLSSPLPKFTGASLIYVCQARCSLWQKPEEQERSDSLRRRKKTCVFSSSIRTTLTACQHQCSVQTPVVRNTFFAHICYQM